jgi:hypothetical protein
MFCKGEALYFFGVYVCTFKRAIKNVQAKVDAQKGGTMGALGFKEKIGNRCVSSIQFNFSSIVII